MSTITTISNCGRLVMNGKVYENVKNMVIKDNGVFIDGKPIEEYEEPPVFNIEVHGNVDSINSENADISVSGDVGSVCSKNGNVQVGRDVLKGVESKNGNIHVNGNVMGDVTTKNGNIHY